MSKKYGVSHRTTFRRVGEQQQEATAQNTAEQLAILQAMNMEAKPADQPETSGPAAQIKELQKQFGAGAAAY